jgi:cytochrome P450
LAGAIHEPIFTGALLQDPYPAYRRLRTEAPAHLDVATGELVLTRYADVVAALRHPRLSSRGVATGGLPIPQSIQWTVRPVLDSLSKQMLFSDPPDHTRLRGLANKAFTPRVVEGMRTRIREISDELLAPLDRAGPVDLVREFTTIFPVTVIAEMLGVHVRDRARFKVWSDDLALFIGGTTLPLPIVLARAARGMLSLRRYFQRLVRERRGNPGNDLLGALIAAEERGDQLTEEELLANASLILAAGHETTTNLIGNGILTLLRHPEQLQLLRENPDLIESAVEELLRYESPVQWTGRVALEALEIGDIRVPAGQSVAIGLAAANRDPAQFPDPDRLDLRREENRHLAFSHGIHFCLGAALARMEGQIAIGELVRRFPHMRLADRPVVWRENFTLRGVKALWLHLRAGG